MSVSHGFRLTNFFVCSTCTFFFFHKYKPFYKCEHCIVYRNCRLMNDDSMSPYFWHVTSKRRHRGHRYLMMKRKLLFLCSDVCGQQNSVFQQHRYIGRYLLLFNFQIEVRRMFKDTLQGLFTSFRGEIILQNLLKCNVVFSRNFVNLL